MNLVSCDLRRENKSKRLLVTFVSMSGFQHENLGKSPKRCLKYALGYSWRQNFHQMHHLYVAHQGFNSINLSYRNSEQNSAVIRQAVLKLSD